MSNSLSLSKNHGLILLDRICTERCAYEFPCSIYILAAASETNEKSLCLLFEQVCWRHMLVTVFKYACVLVISNMRSTLLTLLQ